MKAPKCKLCGHVHSDRDPHVWDSGKALLGTNMDNRTVLASDQTLLASSEPEPLANTYYEKYGYNPDNRRKYMRDLMRKRRAG